MSAERDRIDMMREDLDVEAQRYERAEEHATAAEAHDRSGSVTVRVAADGALEWVRVDESWRQHHAEDQLGGVVLEVYGQAAGERARAWSEASIDTDQAPSRARPTARTSEFSDQVSDALTRQAGAVDPSVLDALGAILDELDRGFDQAMAGVEERLTSPVAGTSTSGHVRASVVADGAVVALDLDQRWLPTAHSFNIGREITEAVLDARRVAAGAAATGLEQSGLDGLRALTSDPQALLRRLGIDPS